MTEDELVELIGGLEGVEVFPHAVYGGHGFVSVLKPDTTAGEVRELVVAAHARGTLTPTLDLR